MSNVDFINNTWDDLDDGNMSTEYLLALTCDVTGCDFDEVISALASRANKKSKTSSKVVPFKKKGSQ